MTDRRRISTLAWVGAGLIVAMGVIIILIGLFTPLGFGSFGWFAYQPLSGAVFAPGGPAVILSRVTIVGWVILSLGAVVLAYLAGLSGRRSSR